MAIRLTERQVEDWAQENIETVTGMSGTYVIARQFRIPGGGIADLAAMWNGIGDELRVAVIELKAGPITEGAIRQCASYVDALIRHGRGGTPWAFWPESWPLKLEGIVAGFGITPGGARALSCAPAYLTYTELTHNYATSRARVFHA